MYTIAKRNSLIFDEIAFPGRFIHHKISHRKNNRNSDNFYRKSDNFYRKSNFFHRKSNFFIGNPIFFIGNRTLLSRNSEIFISEFRHFLLSNFCKVYIFLSIFFHSLKEKQVEIGEWYIESLKGTQICRFIVLKYLFRTLK